MNKFTLSIFTLRRNSFKSFKVALAFVMALTVSSGSFAQNAIVGDGFSTGWPQNVSCPTTGNGNFKYLTPSAETSYSVTTKANGTGDQYFRFGVDWDFGATTKQLAITPGTDTSVSPNVTYQLDTNCTTSGAQKINVSNAANNYIFKTLNAGSSPTGKFTFFEVKGAVRGVSSVTQFPLPTSVTPGSATTVSATLDGTLSTGQAVYLRYTKDAFATSSVVIMTGSGTSYSADIPGGTNSNGANVKYYVFTSGTANVAPNGSNADFYTINLNNNSNANYGYSVTTSPPATTWTGTWSSAIPNSYIDAIIDGNYSGSAFEAKSLKVNAGKTLTINSSVKSGNVTNNGNIIVNNGASLVQTVGASYTGSGTLEAKSSSTSAANKYTFWSSPIFNQNMYGIFGTNTPPFVMIYNTATNYYDTLANPATSVQGKGYSIKSPVANPAVSFSGVPNNGPISIALSTAGETYNLVGNPYPSNLDLAKFITLNSGNIGSTLWFWDYTGGSVASQNGNTASNSGYATYNASGSGTWVKAPNGSAAPNVNYTKVGQAFIVEAISTSLSFDNTLRVADAGVVINKSSNANEGKFWLTLQTSYNAKVTQAITYQNGASNNFDNYDSRAIGVGSDAFYSFADAEKVVIQGRSTFNSSDVVALGNKHFEAGNFKIELTQKEGLFADGQAIYLRDKTLGIETNLQEGAYLFTSTAGDFSDRFEVVYSKSVLGTNAAAKNTLTVYRNGDDFVIDSPSKISSVEVYDASGKLVRMVKTSGNKETISNLSRGVFILKITTATETVSKKVIK